MQDENNATSDTLFAAAATAHRDGRLAVALAAYQKILDQDPAYVPASINLGQLHRRLGRVDLAVACYQRAVEQGGDDAALWFNFANALRDTGSDREALAAYDRSLSHTPQMAEAHLGRAVVLRRLGRPAEASAAAHAALERNSALWRAWSEIGELQLAAGDTAAGRRALDRALQLNPQALELLTRIAALDWQAGRHGPAIDLLRRAANLYPQRTDVKVNIAVCLSEAWQLAEALSYCNEALALKPDHTGALLTAGKIHVYRGEIAAGRDFIERARAANDNEETRRSLAFAALYDDRLSAGEVAAVQRSIVADWPVAPSPRPVRPRGERLTLAYLSPDLHGDHPVAQFMAPLFAAHDRRCFKIVVLHAHSAEDEVSNRLRADCDEWRNVAALDDEALAALCRTIGVDILIDLAGHTAHSRLKVFGRRPAPLQAAFLGFPFTTGYAAVDYLIADDVVCPPPQADLYRERLLYLPHCVFCTPGLGPLPDPERHAGREFVFANFGNLSKYSPSCLKRWARVLDAVPESRMLLKAGGLGDTTTAARIVERFAELGIDSRRLMIEGPSPFRYMLAAYRRVDAILDTQPYNGGTTTFHALAMGVPVVTLPGEAFYSRMGAGILSALGRRDWIAENEDDYVAIAARLTGETGRLRAARADLRRQLQHSPLGDHAAYVAAFENLLSTAYHEMDTQ